MIPFKLRRILRVQRYLYSLPPALTRSDLPERLDRANDAKRCLELQSASVFPLFVRDLGQMCYKVRKLRNAYSAKRTICVWLPSVKIG